MIKDNILKKLYILLPLITFKQRQKNYRTEKKDKRRSLLCFYNFKTQTQNAIRIHSMNYYAYIN